MGFQGIIYRTIIKEPARSLNGFYGIRIKFDVIAIKVTDFRGKGLQNVKVYAANPTSGIPFTGITDKSGSVFMDLDSQTDIVLTKDAIIKTVQYDNTTGSISPTYQIDLPFIQNN